MRRGFILWLGFAIAAPLNGALREFVLIPRWGEASGHIASTLILSGLIVALTWRLLPWLGVDSSRAATGLGLLWLTLTLAFEFLAGHFLFRVPWPKLLAEYDVLAGRIWVLVLVATLAAPGIAWHLRNRNTCDVPALRSKRNP